MQVESQSFSQAASTQNTQTALLFAAEPRKRRADFGIGTVKSLSTSSQGTDTVDAGSSVKTEIMRLKKRFLKSQEASRTYFALQERRRQKLRDITREKQKVARDQRVVMYRKYRAGELPDIQIKHSELIVPLQALAQHDSSIAKDLFEMLLDSIITSLPEKLTDDVVEKAYKDIQSALDSMMTSSSLLHPPFVYAMENICCRHRQLSLDPVSVSTASSTSEQQPMGILLLEKQLLRTSVDIEPKKKRPRVASVEVEDLETWVETAKLYKSIENYDFLYSIFSGQISKHDTSKVALEAEARNDYAQALKLYNQVNFVFFMLITMIWPF